MPSVQCGAQQSRGGARIPGSQGVAGLPGLGLEPSDVDFIIGDVEYVASVAPDQTSWAERLPQQRDMALESRCRGGGGLFGPQILGQPRGGDEFVRSHKKPDKQGPPAGPGDRNRRLFIPDDKGPKDFEFEHCRHPTFASTGARPRQRSQPPLGPGTSGPRRRMANGSRATCRAQTSSGQRSWREPIAHLVALGRRRWSSFGAPLERPVTPWDSDRAATLGVLGRRDKS